MKLDLKPEPNRKIYIELLRRMTPEQRMLKVVELTEFARSLFRAGLRSRNPGLSEDDLHALYIKQLLKWHNLNY